MRYTEWDRLLNCAASDAVASTSIKISSLLFMVLNSMQLCKEHLRSNVFNYFSPGVIDGLPLGIIKLKSHTFIVSPRFCCFYFEIQPSPSP